MKRRPLSKIKKKKVFGLMKDEEEEKGENDISPTNDIVAKQT